MKSITICESRLNARAAVKKTDQMNTYRTTSSDQAKEMWNANRKSTWENPTNTITT